MKKNNKESVVEKDAEIVKDSEQEETSRAIIAQKREIRYSGPIPEPDTFRRYEEVLPGAADRILIMAEKEQNSRHKINDKIVE